MPGTIFGQKPADNAAVTSGQIEASVQKGCKAILDYQGEGGWFSDKAEKIRMVKGFVKSSAPPKQSVAMTSLGLMALASVGHQATDPTDEGRSITAALEFVLRDDLVTNDGYMGQKDGSRMYGHGIACLMMAEMLGMTLTPEQDSRLRTRLQKAIECILRAQEFKKSNPADQGGWRYEPFSTDSDMSVTVWHLMSLRAAQNAGLKVPKIAIDNAIAYLKRCFTDEGGENNNPNPKRKRRVGGSFAYMTNKGERRISTTAAGLLSLQVCGDYEAAEIVSSSDYLLVHPPKTDDRWFYYGTYYYAQGMYQRGGEHADTSQQQVAKLLLEKQEQDGTWLGNGEERQAGPVYSTSLAILSLSVEHHFLPIYQK